MNSIQISPGNLSSSQSGTEFILLGDNDVLQSNLLKDTITTKINTQGSQQTVPGFWGTLGMADDTDINFTGTLTVSKYGNNNSSGETLDLINELSQINPLINTGNSMISMLLACKQFNHLKFSN